MMYSLRYNYSVLNVCYVINKIFRISIFDSDFDFKYIIN